MRIHLSRPSAGTVLGALALFVSLGGFGYSATGGNFILGRQNSAGKQTTLSAQVSKKALQITNTKTTAGATALGLKVAAGHAPFTVSSGTKVTNLNADRLDGIDSASFLTLGLDGKVQCTGCVDAADVSGKVGDSDTLDGIDSSGFMRGDGSADGQAVAIAPNSTVFVGPVIGGLVRLRYACPFSVGGNGTLRFINSSSGIANLFVDSGGTNPDYVQLGAGGFIDYPAAAGGDSFHAQLQGAAGVVTVVANTVHRSSSNDCHVQALGVQGT